MGGIYQPPKDSGALAPFTLPVRLPAYTLATLPFAGAFSGCVIIVSDAVGGPRLCLSDGVNWLRVDNNAPVTDLPV